jgi:hypothetical protein
MNTGERMRKEQRMTDQAYTLDQFTKAFKVGKTRTYEEISSGRLQVYKVGVRTYVSARAAEAWQRQLEQQAPRPKVAQ